MSCSSCLGFIFDNKLSWSPHNKQICCDFKANIANITRFNKFRSLNDQLCHLFNSKLFYLVIPSAFLLGDHHICSLNSHICAVRLIHNSSSSILYTKYFSRPDENLICIRKEWLAFLTRLTMSYYTH